MKVHFQFKDDVSFAYVISENDVDNSVVVETTSPDDYLFKTLNDEGVWESAPSFKYAIVDEEGRIKEIRHTYFPSEIGSNQVMSTQVKDNWIWDGTEFVPPYTENPSV